MLDENLPYQLNTGKQSILLSNLLNAEIVGVSPEISQKISLFLKILADDILCMRDDIKTNIVISMSLNNFAIYLEDSYPFLDFINHLFTYKKSNSMNPVSFYLNFLTPMEMINSHLIAEILDDFKNQGIYKFNEDDQHDALEPFIHVDALDTFYTFDIIDQALGYAGKLSTLVRNRVYHVEPYSVEEGFSMFELRDFNSIHIELTLSNHDFYIRVSENTIKFEYLFDSMVFNLNKKHPVEFNVEKFTKFFLGFFNVQHGTSHDDLPRWITLQEMIAI